MQPFVVHAGAPYKGVRAVPLDVVARGCTLCHATLCRAMQHLTMPCDNPCMLRTSSSLAQARSLAVAATSKSLPVSRLIHTGTAHTWHSYWHCSHLARIWALLTPGTQSSCHPMGSPSPFPPSPSPCLPQVMRDALISGNDGSLEMVDVVVVLSCTTLLSMQTLACALPAYGPLRVRRDGQGRGRCEVTLQAILQPRCRPAGEGKAKAWGRS